MDGLESVIKGIAEKTERASRISKGDYIGDDGLLHCCKCGDKKQCRVTFPWGERVMPCICKCRADEIEAEERETERIAFEKRIEEYRRIGFPESDMKNWTFDNDDRENPQITKIAQNYVKNFDRMRKDGKGLLLYGNVGTGKTYAAACIANALIDKGYACMVTNFSRISNTVNGMYEGRQEYYDGLNKFPLLVIDDLSAERKTEYMQEIVFNVIDSRYRAGLPLIITTNLTGEEIKNPSDMSNKRTFSRLMEMCIPVEVKGKERRREILKDTFIEYKDLLGIE